MIRRRLTPALVSYAGTKYYVYNQKEILEAALTCSRSLVYEVFAREPMLAGRLTDAQCKALAD